MAEIMRMPEHCLPFMQGRTLHYTTLYCTALYCTTEWFWYSSLTTPNTSHHSATLSLHITYIAGRLLHIRTDTEDWGWGSLVAIRKLGLTPGRGEGPLIGKNSPSTLVAVNQNYVLDVLLGVGVDDAGIHPHDSALESAGAYCLSVCLSAVSLFSLCDKSGITNYYSVTSSSSFCLTHSPTHLLTHSLNILDLCEARVVAVALSAVKGLSAVRLNLPKDLTKENSRKGVLKVWLVFCATF